MEALTNILSKLRGGGADAGAGPRIKGQNKTAEDDPWAFITQHGVVVSLRRLVRKKGFRRWISLLAMCAGFLAQYLLVLIPTMACNACAGGALVGSFFAFSFLLVSGSYSVFQAGPATTHLAMGALVAIVPAAYTGATLVTYTELTMAKLAFGADDRGLDPSEGLAADVMGADVFGLKGLKQSNFRYDLMGEAHETLPMYDATYMKKAGKSEDGTYCAVPIVHDSWTIEEAIPFWYICENDWGQHKSCKEAYEGTYNKKDYYGIKMLADCLNKPLKILKEMEASPTGSTVPPMYFYRLDFVSNFNEFMVLARTAIIQSSIDHLIMIRFDAPRVRMPPTQEKCCTSQAAAASAGMTQLSLAALAFVGLRLLLTVFRIFFPDRHGKGTEPAFLTRQDLRRIKLG